MFTFNHSGKIGDLLYSLYFCKSYSNKMGFDKFNFNIQINQEELMRGRQKTKVRLTEEAANYMLPLLEKQSMFNEITISDKPFEEDDWHVNLDHFRQLKLNFSGGYIPEWYFSLSVFPLRRNYEEPLLDNIEPNLDYKDKIIFCLTQKYINPYVKLYTLNKYKDQILFVGLEEEYKAIPKQILNVPHLKVKDALQMAQILKGCKYMISNQNGNFTIAELINANRVLIPPHYQLMGDPKNPKNYKTGPVNNICHGGNFEYANITEKLEYILENGLTFQ